MRLGIMQPYFFPYIGYFQLLSAVDKYVIYDDVNYIKGGWINRNRILINGKDNYLTLKLKDASSFKKINEIEVINDESDKNKMLMTIHNAYVKSPHYDKVYPILKKIIENKETNLAKFLAYSLKEICNYLDIKTEIIVSSSIEKDNNLRSQEKVLHICNLLNAAEYLNAVGGQELYDYHDFKNKGIELMFLETKEIKYTQYHNEFVSNLSIIDILMFNSKEEIKIMLNNYSIIKEQL